MPSRLEQIIDKALEKDRKLRYQSAADLQTDLRRLARDSSRSHWDASSSRQEQDKARALPPVKPKSRRPYYFVAAVALVLMAVAAFLFRRSSPGGVPPSKEWEQLTFFTDSAVYPALSSDGRMSLSFEETAHSSQVRSHVKLPPGGEPVQLIHDPGQTGPLVFSDTRVFPMVSYGHPLQPSGGEPRTLAQLFLVNMDFQGSARSSLRLKKGRSGRATTDGPR